MLGAMERLLALLSLVGARGGYLTSMQGTIQHWPSPDVAIIPENVCSFRVAVERHLKSRSHLPVRLFFRECFSFLVCW